MKKILFALSMLALVAAALPQARGDDVSVDFFYNNLSGGNWIDVEGYGYGWQPDVAVSDPNWRPYSDGYWAYTDYGWTWISYEDFGWAAYHYGRWARLADYGWVWQPTVAVVDRGHLRGLEVAGRAARAREARAGGSPAYGSRPGSSPCHLHLAGLARPPLVGARDVADDAVGLAVLPDRDAVSALRIGRDSYIPRARKTASRMCRFGTNHSGMSILSSAEKQKESLWGIESSLSVRRRFR